MLDYNKLGIYIMIFRPLLATLLLIFSFSVLAQEKIKRPTVEFDSKTYYLAKYNVGFTSTSQIETYYPQNSESDDWVLRLTRKHLFDVTNIHHAAEGFANDYIDYKLPIERIKNEDSNDIIMKVTYYSPVHPLVIDKKIVIFKKIPGSSRIVLYTYVERSFNDPEKIDFDALQKNKKYHLIDDKYVEMMKKLILR